MAISTPERNPGTTLVPIGLAAPWKNRTRKATEKSIQYRNRQEQPEASSDESEDIQVECSQPILRVKKNTTNKNLLATLTEIIQQQNNTITKLGHEIKEIKQKQQILIDYNITLIDEITDLKARVDDLPAGSQNTRSWASVVADTSLGTNATPGTSASHKHARETGPSPADIPYVTIDISRTEDENTSATLKVACGISVLLRLLCYCVFMSPYLYSARSSVFRTALCILGGSPYSAPCFCILRLALYYVPYSVLCTIHCIMYHTLYFAMKFCCISVFGHRTLFFDTTLRTTHCILYRALG